MSALNSGHRVTPADARDDRRVAPVRARVDADPKCWEVLAAAAPSVFLGYRVSRAGLSPARKIRRRLGRRVRLASDKGHKALVRCLVSYRGLLSFG
jgi:hypothetical protein